MNFRKIKKCVLTIVLLHMLFINVGYSQKITIHSIENNQALPFSVIVVSSNKKTVHYRANEKGFIRLEKENKLSPVQLTIAHTGFETKKITSVIIQHDTTIYLKQKLKTFNAAVVTAQYKSQPVENAVHYIKVIDRKQIDALAAQNLKDVLTNTLNIRLGEDMVLGSTIQLHGVGGQNVKILIDGVPITGRLDGNIDLSQIPSENIERVEIVEGPLSVNYGTDALAGTINIITKKSQLNTFEFTSSNYLESSVRLKNAVDLGWRINHFHQISLGGARNYFDGWNPGQPEFDYKYKRIEDSSRAQLWNPKTQYSGHINYRYKKGNNTFNYSGQYLNEQVINKGFPRAPYQETAFDDYYNTQRIHQRISYDHRFKNGYKIALIAGYNGYIRHKKTMIRNLTTLTDQLSSSSSSHDTSVFHNFMSRGRFIQSSTKKKVNYEIGYDINYEQAIGKKITNRKQAIGDYALFATAEYSPISSLTIRPGLRYSYNTGYKAPLTPSLNVKYNFFQNQHHTVGLRASYARGFRSPTIKELLYEFIDVNHYIVGNPDLSAEYSNHYNLSFHHTYKGKNVNMRTKIGGFYSDIKNLITLAQSSSNETHYSYFNLARYTTTGLQIEESIGFNSLSATIGFSYIGRNHHLTANTLSFLFSPEAQVAIQYTWEKPALNFAFFYKYTGKLNSLYYGDNEEVVEGSLEDYHTANVSISNYLWNKRIELSIGVKNLFNVTSINNTIEGGSVSSAHSSIGSVAIGIGRTYHIGIKIHLKSK